jgi:NAD(P)-dependent dehydrogenase (short-subunit alcohol dehydrogenase family)
MSKVWLVTGSASGLGRNIAEVVLASGDRLVATARDPSRFEDGGFTESLAKEVAPFGVKVCALDAAGMRTNWGARANSYRPDLPPGHEPDGMRFGE